MSVAPATSGLTWEDFLALPDDDRYKHAELVDGELTPVSPPARSHQRSNRGYLPDLAWFCAARVPPTGLAPYPDGPPDLAIEVLSPSTRAFDMLRKRSDYARVGVSELWLIDADGPSALVLRLPARPSEPAEFGQVEDLDEDGTLTSPLLPGLAIPLHALTA